MPALFYLPICMNPVPPGRLSDILFCMKFYFAPMEGITEVPYRKAHHQFFPGIDKYFTPFIVTNVKANARNKELQDVLSPLNEGIPTVPQLLSNNAHDFLEYAKFLCDHGFNEINLNAGCPQHSVMGKGRGSGLLRYPDLLDSFLNDIFTGLPDVKLSVKTRLGIESSENFPEIMKIYNRYPISELIIHARNQKDFYKTGTLDMDAFRFGLESSKCPVCYNGDLFSAGDIDNFKTAFPDVESVMLGRGLLMDPGLITRCSVSEVFTSNTMQSFHESLFSCYLQTAPSQKAVLSRMKEFWAYACKSCPEVDIRAVREFKSITEYIEYFGIFIKR